MVPWRNSNYSFFKAMFNIIWTGFCCFNVSTKSHPRMGVLMPFNRTLMPFNHILVKVLVLFFPPSSVIWSTSFYQGEFLDQPFCSHLQGRYQHNEDNNSGCLIAGEHLDVFMKLGSFHFILALAIQNTVEQIENSVYLCLKKKGKEMVF